MASNLLFGGAEKKNSEKTETLCAGTHLNFYFVVLLVILV